MLKIYWRRSLFLLLIATLSLTVFTIFTKTCRNNQMAAISLISVITTNTPQTLQNVPPSVSLVPSKYLVIPYQEFVLRTSITCRSYKLDYPSKDPKMLHPKYSKYLRGRFPFVMPHANITYNDVENFYSDILVNKEKNSEIIHTPFAENITFENIPYTFRNGLWHPTEVTSAQRTAIIVPLLGREYNANTFLLNMHAFLRRQQLTYTIIIAEQASPLGNRFNKGRLYNAAIRYLEQESLNITCLILHDVDLIPENDGNIYSCETKYPKHTTSRIRKLEGNHKYTQYYEFLVGGVLLLTHDMYKNFNGFSNLFWGWGGEDDDLALRFIQQRMCIVRPSYEVATYVALPHPRGQRNSGRYSLLTWSTLRLKSDGYEQIDALTEIVNVTKTPIVTRLKINADFKGYHYKRSYTEHGPSTSKSPVSLNRTT